MDASWALVPAKNLEDALVRAAGQLTPQEVQELPNSNCYSSSNGTACATARVLRRFRFSYPAFFSVRDDHSISQQLM